jgi:tRNA A37 threonylcarbamoyltransferase TsaD
MSSIGLPNAETVIKDGKTYAIDLAERVASTFVVATGGVLITATTDTVGHLSFWQSVAAGGVAAAGSLIKGILARAFGSKDSASLAKGV